MTARQPANSGGAVAPASGWPLPSAPNRLEVGDARRRSVHPVSVLASRPRVRPAIPVPDGHEGGIQAVAPAEVSASQAVCVRARFRPDPAGRLADTCTVVGRRRDPRGCSLDPRRAILKVIRARGIILSPSGSNTRRPSNGFRLEATKVFKRCGVTEAPDSRSPSDRISAAFETLITSAKTINDVSGELAKPVASLEKSLKRLNLGVACWTNISDEATEWPYFRIQQVGYAYSRKHGSWSLAIRIREGREDEPESGYEKTWPFTEAPPHLRIKAVDKLPELIEALVKTTDATTSRLKKTVAPAQELAAAVRGIINPKDR